MAITAIIIRRNQSPWPMAAWFWTFRATATANSISC